MNKRIFIPVVLIAVLWGATAEAAVSSQDIFKQAERYTVRIHSSTITALEGSDRGSCSGSGFIVHIDKKTGEAYVATNKHVIGTGISSIQINFKDGERLSATPIYIDPVYDFGMLKFDIDDPGVPENITTARLGNSFSMETGHPVGTFGNPAGFEYCATEGIISSITNNPGYAGAFIQTDAAINPGNSGGPLISLKTEQVVGINTASGAGTNIENIGFSLAIDQLKPIIEQAVAGELPYAGHIGWLGASFYEINIDRAMEDFGANFTNNIPRKALLTCVIYKGSSAEKSGLMSGDVILSVDDKIPDDLADFTTLRRTLGGKRVRFLVCRLGENKTIEIDLLDQGDLRPREYITFGGMVIQANTPTVQNASFSPECVYVCDVLEGSSAQAWGAFEWPLRGIVVNLQYYPIESLDDFWNAVKDIQPGQPVELFYGSPQECYIVKVVYYYDHEAPKRITVEQ